MKPIDVPLCDLPFLLIKYSTWTLSSSLIYWPFTIVLWQVARYPYKGTLPRSWWFEREVYFFFSLHFRVSVARKIIKKCVAIGKDSYNWSRFWFIDEGIGIFYFLGLGLMFDIWNLNPWSLNFDPRIFEFWSFRI